MVESPEIIPSPDEEFAIQIEWPNARGGIQKASLEDSIVTVQAQTEKAINIAMGTIRAMANRVSKTIQALEDQVQPDEAEVEFGINLDAEVGAVLARASVGAQITVKLKWTIAQPQRATIMIKE